MDAYLVPFWDPKCRKEEETDLERWIRCHELEIPEDLQELSAAEMNVSGSVHMRVRLSGNDAIGPRTLDQFFRIQQVAAEDVPISKVLIAFETSDSGVEHCHVIFNLHENDTREKFIQRFRTAFPSCCGNRGYSSKMCYDQKMRGYIMKDGLWNTSKDCSPRDVISWQRAWERHVESKRKWDKNWEKQGVIENVLQELSSKGLKKPSTRDIVYQVSEYYTKRQKVINPFHFRNVAWSVKHFSDPEAKEAQLEKMIFDVDNMS